MRSFMPIIQYAADISLYAYVLSRPTILTDPWGLEFYERFPNPPGINGNPACGCVVFRQVEPLLDFPHAWIECGRNSWGLGGPGPASSPDHRAGERRSSNPPLTEITPLLKNRFGMLRYPEPKACRCATCVDIINCIFSFGGSDRNHSFTYPFPTYVCWNFVEEITRSCCLRKSNNFYDAFNMY